MSGMNEYLAAHYGTMNSGSPAQPSEDLEKQAQVELFAKLAAENNIDLESLSEAQVATLWNDFQKQASAQAPAEKTAEEAEKEEKEKKMEEAKKEHEEKKEAAAKVAEADFLGRVMAHSYVDELKKIAAAQAQPAEAPAAEAPVTETKEAAMPEHLRKALAGAKGVGKAVGSHMESTGKKIVEKATGSAKGSAGHMNPTHAKAVGGAAHAAGAAAVAGGAARVAEGKKKEKKASALDELACSSALQKCAAAGYDLDETAQRLAAVLELPAVENSKVASVQDLATAIDVRSLELLEMAGYPVTWNNGESQ